MALSNFDVALKKFLETNTNISYDFNFSDEGVSEERDQKETWWAQLIQFLHQEKDKLANFIRTDTFENSSGLGYYLQDQVDLPTNAIDQLIQTIKDNKGYINLNTDTGFISGVGSFWNESVSKSLAYLIKYFLIPEDFETLNSSPSGNTGAIIFKNLNKTFNIKDIRNADAGYKNESPYVIPKYNLDNEAYEEVRGKDLIEKDATDMKNLQYTVEQGTNKYLRLIMPKYEREVKVEDLNRNFWVIAQAVTGISGFLFDEGNPLSNMFESLIKEIIELWENILYLWLAMVLAFRQPKYENVHTEIIYLTEDEFRKGIKYDNYDILVKNGNTNILNTELFSDTNIEEAMKKRLEIYKANYPESNLILIPVFRGGNYTKNYYCMEYYPGYYTFDRNTGEEKFNIFPGKIKYFTADMTNINVGSANTDWIYDGTSEDNIRKLMPTRTAVSGYNIQAYTLPANYCGLIGLSNDGLDDLYYCCSPMQLLGVEQFMTGGTAIGIITPTPVVDVSFYTVIRSVFVVNSSYNTETGLRLNSFQVNFYDISKNIHDNSRVMTNNLIGQYLWEEDNGEMKQTIELYNHIYPYENNEYPSLDSAIITNNFEFLEKQEYKYYDGDFSEDTSNMEEGAVRLPYTKTNSEIGFYMGELITKRQIVLVQPIPIVPDNTPVDDSDPFSAFDDEPIDPDEPTPEIIENLNISINRFYGPPIGIKYNYQPASKIVWSKNVSFHGGRYDLFSDSNHSNSEAVSVSNLNKANKKITELYKEQIKKDNEENTLYIYFPLRRNNLKHTWWNSFSNDGGYNAENGKFPTSSSDYQSNSLQGFYYSLDGESLEKAETTSNYKGYIYNLSNRKDNFLATMNLYYKDGKQITEVNYNKSKTLPVVNGTIQANTLPMYMSGRSVLASGVYISANANGTKIINDFIGDYLSTGTILPLGTELNEWNSSYGNGAEDLADKYNVWNWGYTLRKSTDTSKPRTRHTMRVQTIFLYHTSTAQTLMSDNWLIKIHDSYGTFIPDNEGLLNNIRSKINIYYGNNNTGTAIAGLINESLKKTSSGGLIFNQQLTSSTENSYKLEGWILDKEVNDSSKKYTWYPCMHDTIQTIIKPGNTSGTYDHYSRRYSIFDITGKPISNINNIMTTRGTNFNGSSNSNADLSTSGYTLFSVKCCVSVDNTDNMLTGNHYLNISPAIVGTYQSI